MSKSTFIVTVPVNGVSLYVSGERGESGRFMLANAKEDARTFTNKGQAGMLARQYNGTVTPSEEIISPNFDVILIGVGAVLKYFKRFDSNDNPIFTSNIEHAQKFTDYFACWFTAMDISTYIHDRTSLLVTSRPIKIAA